MEPKPPPSLRDIAKLAVLTHNIDYSEFGDVFRRQHLELIPSYQQKELSFAEKFRFLIDYPNKGLTLSAKYGFVEAFQYFASLGATHFNAAFLEAAKHGHIEIVKLCKHKVEEGQYNDALGFAAEGGYFDIVDLLRSWGNLRIDLAMNMAASGGNLPMVKYLETLGEINYHRAMVAAARGGHLDVMKYLYSRGGRDINTSLRVAAENDHGEIMLQCLKWGATNKESVRNGIITKNNEIINRIQPPEPERLRKRMRI